MFKNVQRERKEKLARFLKEFLSQYVRGDKEGFANRVEAEAKRLSPALVNLLILLNHLYFYVV